ncbi:hypothetical protein [Burkholderia sp. BDU5]|uniref:hypothetical protein n=1 Tax=Burkholderia sp. BDU5 TaxID=1385590 RepID=UPI0012E3D221|nr:hypothetical protein [Burkholderia sp. BDU5]
MRTRVHRADDRRDRVVRCVRRQSRVRRRDVRQPRRERQPIRGRAVRAHEVVECERPPRANQAVHHREQRRHADPGGEQHGRAAVRRKREIIQRRADPQHVADANHVVHARSRRATPAHA